MAPVGAQGKWLRLRREAAEYVFAVAVGGIGERQQAVLDLHAWVAMELRFELVRMPLLASSARLRRACSCDLHLRQRVVLGVQVGLRALRIGAVLLTLRQRLVVVVHAARGRRILRSGGEAQAARHLILTSD